MVNLASPELMSVPTQPSIRPSTTMAIPLAGDPWLTADAASSPSSITAKYSAGPKASVTCTRTGAKAVSATIPIEAPTKEAAVVMNNATPALPCWAIGYPSRQVTAAEGVPGRLSRIEAIEPPYSAP